MDYTFETDSPVDLIVEISSGDVHVDARETAQSTVTVTGDRADEVEVDLRGSSLSVIGPHRTGFASIRSSRQTVRIVVPTGSDLSAKVRSADVSTGGELGRIGVKSGSGDVMLDRGTGGVTVEVGSGDVRVGSAGGQLLVRSGSGDVLVDRAEGASEVLTGSGDVMIQHSGGPVQIKSGSGDLRIEESHGDLDLVTASGDVVVNRFSEGRVRTRNASGDVSIRVPAGTPVWTDISTMTGSIRSSLASTGAPTEGQPHVEIRATTVSGDIRLQNI